MISFLVRMQFLPADRERVAALLDELAAESRKEPGCLSYLPHFLESDPSTVVLYEQYRDQAALDFHRTTAHFQKLAAGGLFQLMRQRQIEHLTSIP